MKKKLVSNEDMTYICSELSFLLQAGVSTGDSLHIMSDDENRKEYGRLFGVMAEKADNGQPLDAIMEEEGVFPKYASNLVSAGTETGRLAECLKSLAAYYRRRVSIEEQLRTAILHPVFLLVVMIVIITVLMTKVVPVFNKVYLQMGQGLTGIGGTLFRIGQILDSAVPFLTMILFVILFLLVMFSISNSFREKMLDTWYGVSDIRGVLGKINRAKFSYGMHISISSGLHIEDILIISKLLVYSSPKMIKRIERSLEDIDSGISLSESLSNNKLLSVADCRLIEAGYRSGNIGIVIEQIAKRLADEAQRDLSNWVASIEPTLVMITSTVIGTILLAVMIPLINIMSALG